MMSSPPETEITKMIARARRLSGDIDAIKDFDDDIWLAGIEEGIPEFSHYKPRRRQATVTISAETGQGVLPADFRETVEDSFTSAVNPRGYAHTWYDNVYTLNHLSMATADQGAGYGGAGSLFVPGTRFSFIDADDGGTELVVDPIPKSEVTLKFLYHGNHELTADKNTIKPKDRDLAVIKMCEYACLAMARRLSGHAQLVADYHKHRMAYKAMFDDRVVFVAVGMAD